jgi:membrane protein YqaA with SNARE-associated domain
MVAGVLRTNFLLFTLLVASGKLARYAVTAWITLHATG